MSETEDERARRLLTRRERSNLRKRFYEDVTVSAVAGGFEVQLDGRSVKTPLKRALVLPGESMAEAIADEWRVQESHIDPSSMIITRLANTAIDRVCGEEARIVREIGGFAASDLVCYRAGGPETLLERQSASWDPVLNWMHNEHGVRFICVEGVMHAQQPGEALDTVERLLSAEGSFSLTAVHNMSSLTGSALIAMMTAAGALSVEAAWAAAHVDEDWQIEQWGSDYEAEERRSLRKADFDATARFLEMSR